MESWLNLGTVLEALCKAQSSDSVWVCGRKGGREGRRERKKKAKRKAVWLLFQSVPELRTDQLSMPLSLYPGKMDRKQFRFRFLFYIKYHGWNYSLGFLCMFNICLLFRSYITLNEPSSTICST